MIKKKIVNVASYKRLNSLVNTVDSILHQCDELNIFLNSIDAQIPEIFYNEKINLFFSDNRYGDSLKFAPLENSQGYYLTIDDDFIYPNNYVNFMISKCEEYSNQRVITLHGKNFKDFPIQSYYRSHFEYFNCLQKMKKNVLVQFGGTGVMCFHTSLLKIPLNFFEKPNMSDVWFGKYCLENKIEIMCVTHPKDFLKYQVQKNTIYDTYSNNDSIQTQIVNSIFNKNESFVNVINTVQTHQKIKIQKTLKINKKTIDYQKVNEIFSNLQNNTQPKPKVTTSNLKLNSKQNSIFLKKKFR
jgi:hypothetical protein